MSSRRGSFQPSFLHKYPGAELDLSGDLVNKGLKVHDSDQCPEIWPCEAAESFAVLPSRRPVLFWGLYVGKATFEQLRFQFEKRLF